MMSFFRRTKSPQSSPNSWEAVARSSEFTIQNLRLMLEARDADVARLQRENDDLVKANIYVVTERNRLRHELALAGRTERGQFARRVG